MDGLPGSQFHAMMMCQPCPGTPVSYVYALYTCPGHDVESASNPIRAGMSFQSVDGAPRMTVACEDSTPPFPCAIATSQSFTCRAPHSPRNWRTASISSRSPYMPGWQYDSPPPLVLTARLPLGAMRPPLTNAPPSPFLQKPRSSKNKIVLIVKAS